MKQWQFEHAIYKPAWGKSGVWQQKENYYGKTDEL